MKLHIEKRVLLGFVITALVITVLGIFSFFSTQRLINTARLLSHATRVINTAEQVVKSIVDIETGQRGFIITGNEEFLEPFYESSKNIENYLRILDSLTIQNPTQHIKVVQLSALTQKQLRWTKQVIEARKVDFEKARDSVVTGKGKQTTDAIRRIVQNLQNNERDTFRQENTISRKSLAEFQVSFVGLATVIAIIIMYLFYTINKMMKKRIQAETRLRRIADEMQNLYDHAPCGYFTVDAEIRIANINQTLLHWLGYTREEMVGKLRFEDMMSLESRQSFLSTFESDFEKYKADGFANDLEFEFLRKDSTIFPVVVNSTLVFNNHGDFAGSRTTVVNFTDRKKAEEKIKLLNQELEAFTYSVSHDLRSPLRAITGYAQIIKEDHGEKLDLEGNRAIQIVTDNALRMGMLIDDLLNFSRIGRKELSHTLVNMDELVQLIIIELMIQENKRNVKLKLLPLKQVKVDQSMIRQVWINLLSNAVKYTKNKKVPEVEIGSFMKDNQVVYYVRDNGAGFDMTYADKLFGVFQRLHKANEFEGTGVGLAIVKTIIKRHGGFVWAEGKVDEGATFYFSLPDEEQHVG